MVLPGVGTFAGAVIGGVIGSLTGGTIGKKVSGKIFGLYHFLGAITLVHQCRQLGQPRCDDEMLLEG